MIQVAMCDDEPSILQMLIGYFNEIKERYSLQMQVQTYTKGRELLACEDRYDIIFLDTELEDMDGITLGVKLREKDKKVKLVYLTAYPNRMKEAFCVHAFDYISKPVGLETVQRVLLDAISYDDLLAHSTVTFQTKTGIVAIKTEEIQYLEYNNRSVYVYSCQNQIIELRGEKISNIAEKMKPYHFEVSHKSFVVNMQQVESVKGYIIYLKSGSVIPLSQSHSKRFRKKLHEYLSTRI